MSRKLATFKGAGSPGLLGRKRILLLRAFAVLFYAVSSSSAPDGSYTMGVWVGSSIRSGTHLLSQLKGGIQESAQSISKRISSAATGNDRLPFARKKVVHEEDSCVTGAHGISRGAQFWARAGTIYISYKRLQLECAARRLTREERKIAFDHLHEKNSERMLDLCLTMRGFFIKAGQFLGTRYDFMPPAYTNRLRSLHDAVPPMPESAARRMIEQELDGPLDSIFESIELDSVVGSASISQVHKGVMKDTGEVVAVKCQYPDAEKIMMQDLSNLRRLGALLQWDLKFDLMSPVDELKSQIAREFDFVEEARHMDRMKPLLEEAVPAVTLPESRWASKRLLIMSFVEGVPMTQLVVPTGLWRRLSSRKGKRIISTLAEAWGYMLFTDGTFNADPHPGNIIIMAGMRLGLLDWGQMKALDKETRLKLARLMRAFRYGNPDEISAKFLDLGVEVADPTDTETIHAIALGMFDSRKIAHYSPFDPRNALNQNTVTNMPAEYFFVLRSVQMVRGLAHGMGVEFSVADAWRDRVEQFLEEEGEGEGKMELILLPAV